MTLSTATPIYRKTSVQHGADADKPTTPQAGDEYNSDDLEIKNICFKKGEWTNLVPINTDSDGTLLFNGSPIIPVPVTTASGTQTNPSATGDEYFERLAGKFGYISKATFINPADGGYGTPLGMRMTDESGNVLDEWRMTGPNEGAEIPSDILQRFTKKKASDKLFIRIYYFPTSGSCTLNYTETAAFLKVYV